MNQNSKNTEATPPARRRAGASLWWLLAVVVAAGAGLWLWHARAPEGAATSASQGASGAPRPGPGRFGGVRPVQPVSVEAVRRQDIRVSVNAIGSITALNTAVVQVQVSGVLRRIDFKEGQQVRAGQVLAQLDPRAFEATLAQAEGALARDTAQLDGARVDLARYRELLAKDGIAKQQLDTQASLVVQLEGTVKLDQATVQSARLQLSYTRVTAPIAGRVGLKQLDLGNVAQPGDANGIVVITQTRPIALVFAVPAADVPRITERLRANEKIAVQAFARDGKTRLATGQVASVDNAIDPSTDTLKLKALFANTDDALFPNQAVSVVLQLDTLKDVLAVPQAAVLRGAQGFYVYVVDAGNVASTRVVVPGATDRGWTAVEGKLQAGERVVIDGTDRLREGAKVEIIAADPSRRVGAAAPPGGGRRHARGAAASAASAAPPAASAASGNRQATGR